MSAIDYDFYPRYQTAKTVSDTLKSKNDLKPSENFEIYTQGTIRKVDIYLGNLLKETIDSVKKRNGSIDDSWSNAPNKFKTIFPNAMDHRNMASQMLNDTNYPKTVFGPALNCVRKALESLLKDVIKLESIEVKNKAPIDSLELPVLVGAVSDASNKKRTDHNINKFIRRLQDITTTGSHDQGKAPIDEIVTREMVEGAISEFDRVLKYFEGYVVKDDL